MHFSSYTYTSGTVHSTQHIWHRGLSKSGTIDELSYRSEDICCLVYMKSVMFWIVKERCTQQADCTDVHHGADVLTAAQGRFSRSGEAWSSWKSLIS